MSPTISSFAASDSFKRRHSIDISPLLRQRLVGSVTDDDLVERSGEEESDQEEDDEFDSEFFEGLETTII